MNSKAVAYKAFLIGFLLGVVLFFIPWFKVWFLFLKNIFYPLPVSAYILAGVTGLLFGTLLDASYMIYLKEGKWGLIRIAGFVGILLLIMVLLSNGFFGSHVLYF